MFSKAETNKNSFLEEKQKNRNNRQKQIEEEKKRDHAILIIQKVVRGWLARTRFKRKLLSDFDETFPDKNSSKEIELKPCLHVFKTASHFLLQWKSDNLTADNRNRLERLCRYLRVSIESESVKFSYVAVALNKDYSLLWIKHMKKLLYKCCVVLEQLRPETHNDSLSFALILHTLVSYTTPNSWAILKSEKLSGLKPGMQQLCNNILGDLIQRGFFLTLRTILIKGTCTRSVVTLKPISLTAIMTLAIRPLIYGNFTQNLLNMFICQILAVPAIISQLETLAPDSLMSFHNHSLFEKCVELMYDKENFKFISNSLQGTKLLSLTANLIHLYYMESTEKMKELAYPMFTNILKSLFETIPDTVEQHGTCTQWHELLGWFTPNAKEDVYENLSLIKKQVKLLWHLKITNILLGDQLKQLSLTFERVEPMPTAQSTPSSSNSLIKRAIECSNNLKSGIINKNSKSAYRKFDNYEVQRVANTCAMYYEALKTLPQLKCDILVGICYNDTVLHDLWLLITSLGTNCGLKSFIDLIKYDDIKNPPGLLLLLFCDCMTHYVTILDDMEMYEQQKHFTVNDYVLLSSFLNNLLYKTVHDNLIEPKTVFSCPLYVSLHTLLLCLYRRDCRRPFAPDNHWIIKEVKPSYFLIDLEKGKKHIQLLLQKMPHIIPHEHRVALFRKFVQNEKAVLGLTDSAYAQFNTAPSSALVTVHRDRIVEDGYRQLAALPPRSLKGVIRVRFINQQGLDEAGIDQDGVFKEFLEETIKKVFDPSLNLFKTTSENRLYPSPTSYLQENHLQLFEFVGRMLGKAVYEGIVVEIPFASFFLSQVLGQTQQALYSCIDELPSLDKELYRSLTFIKHYMGDVADLQLTFSVDEDVMGKIVTHELNPGGRLQPVTNENKINYIHSMAFFRMHTQICEQTSAFIKGFRSIINPDWLALFSTPELQRLISGDTSPLDLKDLRRNTQYYGGFHDSHRVVGWLWEILAKDFTEEERRLFLKFVTSCSKPPLLGFAHLEPPFSIRCVEVGDDEDTGDTIGSVIRGFFTIRKKEPLNRLPTSSTCFNLLKLPNYQKKGTLREKLRYAINSNTGFELS